MAKRKMIPTPADNIAKQIMETYQPQDAQEIQDVVKRIFAPIFEAALKGEMQNHLGYADHEHTVSRASMHGCRFLTNSSRAAWKPSAFSPWTA